MRSKLLYILPEANPKTHMKYNVEFLKALSDTTDIFLILERGDKDLQKIQQQTGAKHIYYTGNSFLTRIPKLKFYLLKACVLGYRKVYVQYSFVGAIYASINPFFTVYYWNCGIPWQYKRPIMQELYESLSYKLIDHFVTGAEVLTKKYSDFYNFPLSKSVVIANWIDIEKFREIFDVAKKAENQNKLKQELKISVNNKVLFFNQRLAERKGAHYLPEILNSASKILNGNVTLVITNDGPYKEKLIEEFKNKNLFEKVVMLGRVPNERVTELLSIVDLYVLPSEEEGMSHSLLEAMCASVPAVSFDVGGTIDMYPEGFKDFVVPAKDISKFIEKVGELLRDDNKGKELGDKLFEQVKKYDKKLILEEFKAKIL